jgi:hypothetical protein
MTFGDWGGDVTAFVSAVAGITPTHGMRMLQFISTDPQGPHEVGVWSELRQLIDLSPFSNVILSGTAKVTASFYVNRVSGDSETDTQFGFLIAAYAGAPETFPSQFNDSELASIIVRFYSDSDVETWELVSGELDLPADTDFLMLEIYAGENVFNDAVDPELDGHFADDVFAEVVAPVPVENQTWGHIKALFDH